MMMYACAFQSFISPQIPVQTHHLQHKCYGIITYSHIYMYASLCCASRSGKEASGAYDHLGELDQALFMYLDHGSSHGGATHQEQRRKYRCVRMHMLYSSDRNSTAVAMFLHACFALQEVRCKLIISSNGSRLRLVQSYQLLVVFYNFFGCI